jgi:hypothetical protein
MIKSVAALNAEQGRDVVGVGNALEVTSRLEEHPHALKAALDNAGAT